jgi:cytochrome oxidase Cu insertion factor (SCO1/SenC/PrrC family)
MKKVFMIFVAGLVLFAAAALLPFDNAIAQKQKRSGAARATSYSCPMHPEVVSKRRGKCPKCGMQLRLVKNEPAPSTGSSVPADEAMAVKPNDEKSIGTMKIPDTPVYDQDGRRLNFYTDLVKGKTVAINFIFTTCTTICPPMTATFRRVQQELRERVGRDVYLISVSVDPVTDVPDRLKAFAASFKAGAGWTFVTGTQPDISGLLKSLGGFVADKNDHTALVLVGNDSRGYWIRTYGLSSPGSLVKIISETAAAQE